MRVYHSSPAMGWTDEMRANVPTMTVVEEAPVSQFTGLLDARGNKLFATDVKEPVGFVVFKER